MLGTVTTFLSILAVDSSLIYRGDRRQTEVPIPRIDAAVVVDGTLSEPVWQRAARLTGFSQFSPTDGRLAEQPTEVLVWYSPTAIHFGVKAAAPAGSVQAHLADRDRGIIPDDYIEFQIGTFNDGRQAFTFGVNPLGVQADGSLVEGTAPQRRGSEGGNDRSGAREQGDLSPDYVWDSKGRLTEFGYEIEIRIPFKSLRYQRVDPQTWALQVIRKTAGSGREDTWTPVQRAAASFLAQAGHLVGLTGIKRGLVLEVNPIVTSSVQGSRLPAGVWDYRGGAPEFGGNVKWGVSTDVSMNGTVNPDFSQVESDASQITPDPRSSVFFQEKRPFFLDGIEYFSTPSQLIYTRRIAAPLAAAKFTGRTQGVGFGFMSAIDDRLSGTSGDHPIYNLLRVQRDVGKQSRIGFAYTDRIEGDDYNRVGQIDTRQVFGGVYSLSANAALSRTRADGAATTGPSWAVSFSRTGRHLGWQLTSRGFSPDFRAQSGFISRGDLAQVGFRPSVTTYGKPGALVERLSVSTNLDVLWTYRDFFDGKKSLERKFNVGTNWTLRGGWTVSLSALIESFSVDRSLYKDYGVAVPGLNGAVDTIAYNSRPLADLPNYDILLNFETPQVAGFKASGFLIYGQDENFFEWSKATIWFGRGALAFRPTDRLRLDGNLSFRTYRRKTDGSTVGSTWIPRLKVEYQVSRAIFFRLVGEYTANRRSDLRDDGRTNAPILIRDPEDGIYKRSLATAAASNNLRVDWLFSYQPTPGTVFFAGYGSRLDEQDAFRFRRLTRSEDGFFMKFSYLFHL